MLPRVCEPERESVAPTESFAISKNLPTPGGAVFSHGFCFALFLGFSCFLRQGLILSFRLECSGAHCSLPLPSPVARTTGTTPANFCILVETGFHHVGHAGLELLTSGDGPGPPWHPKVQGLQA